MHDEFHHFHEVQVRWGDQDTFEHVNNAVYFTYFESARVAYLEDLGFWSNPGRPSQGPVLARITCDFRHQLQYPATIQVGTRVDALRTRSFSLRQAIFLEDSETLVAEGDSVIVWFDYQLGHSIPLPGALPQAVERLESASSAQPVSEQRHSGR